MTYHLENSITSARHSAYKSKVSTEWRCIRDRAQRGSDSPKVTMQNVGLAEIDS